MSNKRDSMTYVGIHDDSYGGMTPIGTIIRDAWVFGILPESEDCAGWTHDRIQEVYDAVSDAWAPYGHLASRLPEDLRARHQRIHDVAVERARSLGWVAHVDEDEA
ncbi:MAG: hypothetical protein P8X48_09330 [Acidiferrobacteraceae bacterium]|jgi:hypothetical protein